MTGSTLGPQAMQQLHGLFRDTAKLKRRRRNRVTPRRGGGGGGSAVDDYIAWSEMDDLITDYDATKLVATSHDTLMVVFTGNVDASAKASPDEADTEDMWAMTYNGNSTGDINCNISGPDLVTELEALTGLESGDVVVTAFAGRYLISLFDSDDTVGTAPDITLLGANSSDLSLHTMQVDYQGGAKATVRLGSLEDAETVSAGQYAWGVSIRGKVRLLPECRDFSMIGGTAPDPETGAGHGPGVITPGPA